MPKLNFQYHVYSIPTIGYRKLSQYTQFNANHETLFDALACIVEIDFIWPHSIHRPIGGRSDTFIANVCGISRREEQAREVKRERKPIKRIGSSIQHLECGIRT